MAQAYSVEEVDGFSRTYFDAVIPAEDITDTYLPAWKAVVQDGGVGSVMCSCELPFCTRTIVLH